jgi:hypothetical protein
MEFPHCADERAREAAMRKSILIGCSLVLLGSCTKELTTHSFRAPASVSPRKPLLQQEEFTVHQKSEAHEGFFNVGTSRDVLAVYNVTSCEFKYEKGFGVYTENEVKYHFQSLTVILSGQNSRGEESFESFRFTDADEASGFNRWEFASDFSDKNITYKRPSGTNEEGTLSFKRLEMPKGELNIEKNNLLEGVKKSTFYRKGEKRSIKVKLNFDFLTDDLVSLESLELDVVSKIGHKKRKSVKVNCSKFSNADS